MSTNVADLLQEITRFIDNGQLSTNIKCINDILRQLVHLSKDISFRNSLPRELFSRLSSLTCFFSSNLKECDVCPRTDFQDIVTTATECFRLLRNACAGCPDNQEAVCCEECLLEETVVICKVLCQSSAESSITEPELTCLRCLVQFVGNAVTDFPPCQIKVWTLFRTQLRKCLELGDVSLAGYSSMVIYNCMMHNTDCVTDLAETSYGAEVVSMLLELLKTQDLDWGVYILESLFKQAMFLRNIYIELTTHHRNLLLDFLVAQLQSHSESGDISAHHVTGIHEDNILYVSGLFKNDAHSILRLSQQEVHTDVSPDLLMCALSILCSASARHDHFPSLLQDGELITTCVNLLHCTKLVGEQATNVFSSADKLSRQEKQGMGSNPVYGLKRDLIRVVGNLAYKNRSNQDRVREAGGIPLILDHTNIDGRNPFITQWAVFAIRNLCDENKENQAVIAGLKLEGLADSVEELRRFGVECEVQGEKLVVKKVSDATLEQPSPFSERD